MIHEICWYSAYAMVSGRSLSWKSESGIAASWGVPDRVGSGDDAIARYLWSQIWIKFMRIIVKIEDTGSSCERRSREGALFSRLTSEVRYY